MEKWLENSVFYQIYPQSFQDTDGDGIGDLQGIIDRLDYVKNMGFTAIWMNPCFESPFGDAGYDISDYCRVAPRYGTNDDLVRLFDEVHKRGMHMLLDLVPGHTSIRHPWFQESCKPESNEYSGRYIWSQDMHTDVADYPNISGSLRGMFRRDGSVAVNFFSHQPALNYGFRNPTEPWQSAVDSPDALATRQAMKDVMSFWLSRGCDGFRVDMAGSLIKNDPDGEETIKLWRDMRAFLDEKFPHAVLLSEWGQPDKSLQAGFDMDFLLHFGTSHFLDLFRCEHPYFSREGKGDLSSFVEAYKGYVKAAGGRGFICIPSGNHDMDRISRFLDQDEIRTAFAFLMSMPGVPFIYYGDEIGMRYIENLVSVEGGYHRTGSRSPMQWDHSKNYGFSKADADRLYIAQDSSDDAPTVEDQQADEGSLLNELKKLIVIRKEHPALCASGDISFVYSEPESYPLAYMRTGGNEKILVVINPSAEESSFPMETGRYDTLYSSGKAVRTEKGRVYIPGGSAAFLKLY